MARVALTEAQRRKQRCERRSKTLAGGLAVYKNHARITNEDLADELGIGKNTVSRLLSGEDVKISIMTYWRLLEICGLEVRQRNEEGAKAI